MLEYCIKKDNAFLKTRGTMPLHELEHGVAIGTLVELIYFDNTNAVWCHLLGFHEEPSTGQIDWM